MGNLTPDIPRHTDPMRTSSKPFPAINHTSRSLVHRTSYHLSHPLHRSLHVVDTEEPPILRMVKPGSSIGMPSKIKLEEPESSSSSEDLSGGNGADVTFGELQEVRSNGSHVVHLKPKEEKGGRANKNRPMEVTCTKPVPRFREVIQGSKKAEIRKKRLVEKYKQLKASGKLEAFIEKRSRKNAAKDHRYMPYRGPDATE
ncbi:unnamed protein product [Malus baccata var. baccata]